MKLKNLIVNFLLVTEGAALAHLIDRGGELPSSDIGSEGLFR